MGEQPDELVERCVVPFYLQMMGPHAVVEGLALLPQMARVPNDTTPQEVAILLGGHWRPRVMGSWLAVRFRGQCVEGALEESIRTCRDGESAAPLATAACLVLGLRGIPPLRALTDQGWGRHGYVAAALEHLGDAVPPGIASRRDHEVFEQMMSLAQQLQAM